MLTFKEDIYSTSNLMANSYAHAQKSGDKAGTFPKNIPANEKKRANVLSKR